MRQQFLEIKMKHGTRYCYQDGCRCDACREAQSQYHRDYLERKENAATRPYVVYTPPSQPEAPTEAGPVELAVQEEINGLAPTRPALAPVALAMAKDLRWAGAHAEASGGKSAGHGARHAT
jgi:hypothetical protein